MSETSVETRRTIDQDPDCYCSNCGIQFMTPETLMGHKMFYCSCKARIRPEERADTELREYNSLSCAKRLLEEVQLSDHKRALDSRLCAGNWLFPGLLPNVMLPPTPPLVLATPILTNVGIQYVPVAPAGSSPGVFPLVGSQSQPQAPPSSCFPMAPFGIPLRPTLDDHQAPLAKRLKCREQSDDRHSPRTPDERNSSPVVQISQQHRNTSADYLPVEKLMPAHPRNNNSETINRRTEERSSPKCASDTALDLTVKDGSNPNENSSGGKASQSEFICVNCNVTFHKRENYIAHKTLYCAQRHRFRSTTEDICDGVPQQLGTRRVKKVADCRLAKAKDTTEVHEDAVHQCPSCSIKFKSVRTLEAHQQYYCPAKNGESIDRPGSGEKDLLSAVDSKTTPRSTVERTSSDSKRNALAVAPNRTSRNCDAAGMNALALRRTFNCEVCDETCLSLDRLVEHLRTHSLSVCYACKLCGYRGNTVRGLKIHGKLHVDDGVPFTEENIAVIRKAVPGENSIALALLSAIQSHQQAFLREFRKEEERLALASARRDLPNAMSPTNLAKAIKCTRCNHQFLDADNLEQHKQTCQQRSERSTPIDDASSDRVKLEAHTTAQRKSDENSNCSLTLTAQSTGTAPTQVVRANVASTLTIGLTAPTETTNGGKPALKKPPAKLCRNCGVSFNHLSTYVAHKKYYCRRKQAAQVASVVATNTDTTTISSRGMRADRA